MTAQNEKRFNEYIAEAFKARVNQLNYPCIAAMRSVNTDDVVIASYDEMCSQKTTRLLGADLLGYIAKQRRSKSPYLSFIAAFHSPCILSEIEFETLLWNQLTLLDTQFSGHFEWDRRVSSDPTEMEFCFSFAGEGFFIVGMHPLSSRKSRIFPFPVMVFNLYEQFEQLKKQNIYEKMKSLNRTRDIAFQGTINPMLTKFGETAEAVQYSGRDVGSKWQCPFHH